MWVDLEQLPAGAIDRESIVEESNDEVDDAAAQAVQDEVRVVDFTNMTFNCIRSEGAKFKPVAGHR